MQWLSRTIAILIFMVGPGLIGMALDRRLGTGFLSPAGFVVGIALATTALLVMVNKFSPPARGQPLPFDDNSEDDLPEK